MTEYESPSSDALSRILLLCKRPEFFERIEKWLAFAGYDVTLQQSPSLPPHLLANSSLVVLCVPENLNELDPLLQQILSEPPNSPLILLVPASQLTEIYAATHTVAHDYIPMPIQREILLTSVRNALELKRLQTLLSPQALPPAIADNASLDDAIIPLAEIEKQAILRTLALAAGNVDRCAKLLRIGRATLYRRLAQYGNVDLRQFKQPSQSDPENAGKSK